MSNLADKLPMFFFGKTVGHALTNVTIYHTHSGMVQPAPKGYGLTVLKGGPGLNEYSLVLNSLDDEFELDYESLTKSLRGIDRLVVDSYDTDGAYRGVKDNQSWKTMYRVDSYAVPRLSTVGGTITGQLSACPCFNCGFITPMAGIEIDHHKPQVGGGDQAIMKVFRHLGMTQSPGKGKLAIVNKAAIQAGKPGFGGHAVAMNPKNNAMGSWNPNNAGDDDLKFRYALDMEGIMVLSVAASVSTLEDIRKRCLNSFVNLRPFCSACNNNKSNKIKTIL